VARRASTPERRAGNRQRGEMACYAAYRRRHGGSVMTAESGVGGLFEVRG
jgi:hypothetical protein